MINRLVVLDAGTLGFGEDIWNPFRSLVPDLVIHDALSHEENAVEKAISGTTIVLTNKVPLSERVIRNSPALRCICVLATGYNVIDVQAANDAGIVVCNVPAYSTASVAQHAAALLLALVNRVETHAQGVFRGDWTRSHHFSYWMHTIPELAGKQAGLIGWGHISRCFASVLHALGMSIQVHTRTEINAPDWEHFKFIDLDTLVSESDVVSLHCPLNEGTRYLLNENRLRMMRPDAFLLNTARGGLVDESALAKVLQEGHLGGVGLDVLEQEPMRPDHPLLECPRVVITPHLAWASGASRMRLVSIALENVEGFVTGCIRNAVT